MGDTPSSGSGVVMPWKWTSVFSGREFLRTNFTLSLGFTLIHGPGTISL